MIVESILALMPLFEPEKQPKLLQGFGTHSACQAKADQLNRIDEDLRKPDARVIGLEYVCLKVFRSRV